MVERTKKDRTQKAQDMIICVFRILPAVFCIAQKYGIISVPTG